MEDNSLLLQIDLSSLERQLKSKTSKSERDVNKLTEDVGDLKQKTRGLQKSLNSALAEQERLAQVANATSSRVQQLQMEVKLNVLDDWLPYNFEYMKTRTDCFGEQYVRKSGFKTGRLVGVVLCSRNRYKIFLGQSLTDTFKNIGDDSGMGEDHCQFVNARSMSKVKVSSFRTSTETEPGEWLLSCPSSSPSSSFFREHVLCSALLTVSWFQCSFPSTETVRTIRDGEPRTSTSTFTQLLSSVVSVFNVALRPQRP